MSTQPAATLAIFPENWQAVNLFAACTTQWRTADNKLVGLDYAAVGEVMRIYRVANRAKLFESIRTMELAALKETQKRQK